MLTNFSEILMKFTCFHSRKCIWKYRLRNGVHFVSTSMCQGHYVEQAIPMRPSFCDPCHHIEFTMASCGRLAILTVSPRYMGHVTQRLHKNWVIVRGIFINSPSIQFLIFKLISINHSSCHVTSQCSSCFTNGFDNPCMFFCLLLLLFWIFDITSLKCNQ